MRKVAWSMVRVDSNMSERAILEMSRFFNGTMILLDSVTYAGFDVVDPSYLFNATGKSIIVIQTHSLDLARVKKALQKHFPDWCERYKVIDETYRRMIPVETPWRVIKILALGMHVEDAIKITRRLCLYSPIPEPLRIADKIASAISRTFL